MFTLCASTYVVTTDVTSCNITCQFIVLYYLMFGVICKGDNQSGRNIQGSLGKEVKVARTCNEKRRMCGQESDGDVCAVKEKENNTQV